MGRLITTREETIPNATSLVPAARRKPAKRAHVASAGLRRAAQMRFWIVRRGDVALGSVARPARALQLDAYDMTISLHEGFGFLDIQRYLKAMRIA